MDDRLERSSTGEMSAPLSFAQQRLWLLDRLIPLGSVYNNPHVSCVTGELDPLALEKAINEVVCRHEVLRTRFGTKDGEPVQVIAPALRVPLALDDLSLLPSDERESEAKKRATAIAALPFDLERGPLLRARLIRLAPTKHWLVIVWHHIVTDGWSSGVLTRELTALYTAFRQGDSSPLPPLPVQYADFAQWQRQWLQGPLLDKLVAYWRKALEDLPTLELPTDRPHPTAASYRGGRVELAIPEPLMRSLMALSRRESVTLFMTMLAAYQVLLHRYSGQDDIAIGVPTAGRSRRELEPMIGFFVNTLVLRGNLAGNPPFREYLARVRAGALAAYTHQELPFEKLVEELAPKRDLARNPLFQASLAVNNTPTAQWKVAGLDVKRIDGVLSGTSKFDLGLFLQEDGAGAMAGYLDYATDLFDAATARQIVDHLLCLLESIVADPGCAIGELPLLGPGERQRLLVEWNATTLDCPRDRCIHQLFEAAAAKCPDAVAIEFGETRITYGELDARANRIAQHLASLRIGPNVPVGICMRRSIDMVASLLGVLKAGGAYVPLDPRYPEARLRFILDDANVAVLLTQRGLAELIGAARCRVVDVDAPTPPGTFDGESPRGPVAGATAEDLAYIIYTSGSTGTPKGVAIEHRNAVAFLHWVRAAFDDDDLSGVLGSTSVCFDLSIFELFGALSWGGRVILVEDALELATCPRRHEVTLVNTVPSVMRTLLEAHGLPESVHTVNLAGEPLGEELVEAIYARPHVRDVHDLYGPTETTTYSTWVRRSPGERPTIGRPIGNTQIYLLDKYGNPVPPRVSGEIHIGGEGVARGYLNRPELTAERFVPDPFSGRAGARLYRTGDFARYRHDGCIEFLGRADNQVKLRGFRIELNEVQAVLSRHPDVREAAVIVREDKPGDKRLVAYVTARDEAPLAADLEALVARQLPYYMVPDAFVALAKLPKTPNGKLDRQALPVPEYETGSGEFQAPQTPLEIAMAEIWAGVLDVPRVGLDDNFFDLGGHSLLAARLLGKIKRSLGIELSLRQLFQAPSVRELTLAALVGTVEADAS